MQNSLANILLTQPQGAAGMGNLSGLAGALNKATAGQIPGLSASPMAFSEVLQGQTALSASLGALPIPAMAGQTAPGQQIQAVPGAAGAHGLAVAGLASAQGALNANAAHAAVPALAPLATPETPNIDDALALASHAAGATPSADPIAPPIVVSSEMASSVATAVIATRSGPLTVSPLLGEETTEGDATADLPDLARIATAAQMQERMALPHKTVKPGKLAEVTDTGDELLASAEDIRATLTAPETGLRQPAGDAVQASLIQAATTSPDGSADTPMQSQTATTGMGAPVAEVPPSQDGIAGLSALNVVQAAPSEVAPTQTNPANSDLASDGSTPAGTEAVTAAEVNKPAITKPGAQPLAAPVQIQRNALPPESPASEGEAGPTPVQTAAPIIPPGQQNRPTTSQPAAQALMQAAEKAAPQSAVARAAAANAALDSVVPEGQQVEVKVSRPAVGVSQAQPQAAMTAETVGEIARQLAPRNPGAKGPVAAQHTEADPLALETAPDAATPTKPETPTPAAPAQTQRAAPALQQSNLTGTTTDPAAQAAPLPAQKSALNKAAAGQQAPQADPSSQAASPEAREAALAHLTRPEHLDTGRPDWLAKTTVATTPQPANGVATVASPQPVDTLSAQALQHAPAPAPTNEVSEAALPQTAASQGAPLTRSLMMNDREWPTQLTSMIKEARDLTQGDIEISLQPERLGKLTIKMDMRDNAVSVTIVTDNDASARLLNDNQSRLADLMAKAGLDLTQHNASTGQQGREGFGQNAQSSQDGRSGQGGSEQTSSGPAQAMSVEAQTATDTADNGIDILA